MAVTDNHWAASPLRRGALGALDRFIGPGATQAELWLQFGGAAAIACLCFALYWTSNADRDALRAIVVVLLALDIAGGVVTNATASAKRWYHRDGQGWRSHLAFVAAHAVQLALVAWLFAEQPWLYLAASYGLLLIAAGAVLGVPRYLQRPVAYGAYAVCFLTAQLPLFSLPGLGWFLPLFYFKLLVSHLVLETPFRPD